MGPVLGEVTAGSDRLGAFVGVVREDEVVPAAVKIKAIAEDAEAHRHALDVPARTAIAPRRGPGRLAGLGRFPEREVEWVFLGVVDLDPGTGTLAEIVERTVDEVAVAIDSVNPKIDTGVVGVGRAVVDQGLDELDHLLDVLGRMRPVVGAQDVQRVHDVVVDLLPLGGNCRLGGVLGLGAGDDLVVDVGDVGDMVHCQPAPFEVAAHDVVGHGLAGVAEVGVVVDRWPARVQRDLAFVALCKRTNVAGQRVVEADHDGLSRVGQMRGDGAASSSTPTRAPSSRRSVGAVGSSPPSRIASASSIRA